MIKKATNTSFVLIMVIYLAGIFMGAIDTGIVTPARTIIQTSLGVDAQTGIWMINIYTLAYATSIPIMGKLADKYGRKYVYLFSISLFGLGSLFCGLSETFGGFPLLIIARAVQAIGGGGILPVATAEFGTSFPPEKRGMALGLVGGVYGIANIFGASAGSAILDIFGKDCWSYIFYINIPITFFILVAGFRKLANTKVADTGKIDGLGIFTLTAMILSLLYGLRNLDFFDIGGTIVNSNVYAFLLLFVILLPIFIAIERKSQDPVLNLKYFTNKNIVIALLISFVSGFVMMGMIFVPQFSENALKISSGSGGYLVILLGVFAGVGAPLSGKLIDQFGAKIILGIGFLFSIFGSLFLVFVTTAYSNIYTVVICLSLIGVGIGFTMGTPLNYIMLANTAAKESNSSLATLSLVRSIGTAIAPAIMVGFIAHAGMTVQDNIMDVLPKEIIVPPLVYSQEITDELNRLRVDPDMADVFVDMNIPDLTSMQKMEIDMNGDSDFQLPADLLELMQSSDVTNIVANVSIMVRQMFDQITPNIILEINDGIDKGIGGIGEGITEMNLAVSDMREGYDGIGQGINGMQTAISAQSTAKQQLRDAADMLNGFRGGNLPMGMTLLDFIPDTVKNDIPDTVLADLAKVKSLADLDGQIDSLDSAISSMGDAACQLRDAVDMLNGFRGGNLPKDMTILDFIPTAAQDAMPDQVLDMLQEVDSLPSLRRQTAELEDVIESMEEAAAQLDDAVDMLNGFRGGNLPKGMTILDFIPAQAQDAMPEQVLTMLGNVEDLPALYTQIDGLTEAVASMTTAKDRLISVRQMLQTFADGELPGGMTMLSFIPASVQQHLPQSVLDILAAMTSLDDLEQQIAELEQQRDEQNAIKSELMQVAELIGSGTVVIEDGQSIADALPQDISAGLDGQTIDILADLFSSGELNGQIGRIGGILSGLAAAIEQINDLSVSVEPIFAAFANGNIPQGMLLTDLIPAPVKANMPQSVLDQLAAVRSFADLDGMIEPLAVAVAAQNSALVQMNTLAEMLEALSVGKIPQGMSLTDFIPEQAKSSMPKSILRDLAEVRSVNELRDMADDLTDAIAAQEDAVVQMEDMTNMLESLSVGNIPADMSLTDFIPEDAKSAMPEEVLTELSGVRNVNDLVTLERDLQSAVTAQQSARQQLRDTADKLAVLAEGKIPAAMNFTDFIPADVKAKMPQSVIADMSGVRTLGDLRSMIGNLDLAMGDLTAEINTAYADRQEMSAAINEIKAASDDMNELSRKMQALQASVNEAFAVAADDYLQAVADNDGEIETVFQSTLNDGFKNIYLTSAIAGVIAILLLIFYSPKKENLLGQE